MVHNDVLKLQIVVAMCFFSSFFIGKDGLGFKGGKWISENIDFCPRICILFLGEIMSVI